MCSALILQAALERKMQVAALLEKQSMNQPLDESPSMHTAPRFIGARVHTVWGSTAHSIESG